MKAKHGMQRRQLQAHIDQAESRVPLKNNDFKGFEKSCDLVRVPVVELQAKGRDSELEAGTFHSLLVKKRVEA